MQGGTLVLQHRMNQGALISFMLYQGSLSSAFDSLGYCFTGMAAAVGPPHSHPSSHTHCLCYHALDNLYAIPCYCRSGQISTDGASQLH